MLLGAWILSALTDDMLKIQAKATVLATGGGAGIFENHLTGADATGEGMPSHIERVPS